MTAQASEVPDLLYTDVEDDLRTALRDLLASAAPWSQVLAGLDDVGPGPGKLWTRLSTELGLSGLPVAEDEGGAGATWREVAVVLEELGRSVTPVPYLTSSVMATSLLQTVGATELLTAVASGETVAALVVPLTWSGGPVDVEADGDRLTGTVTLVAGAVEADVLLVPTPEGVFAVDAHLAALDPVDALDMTRPLADVRLAGASGTRLSPDGADETLSYTASVAAAMLASEQLGIAEWCLDSTVAYLQERRQFGRVLASYQAPKHRLADLWTELTQARAVARYAAAVTAASTPTELGDLHVAASLAKVVCSRVAVHAAEECLQLHGGIGFTWEHPTHLYLKRARADALALGSPSHHRDRIGALVDLPRENPTLRGPR